MNYRPPACPPRHATLGKCSALIKVTGDLGDLLVGHSTHDSFTAMTRIYKHYDFTSLADDAIAARRVSFSSYPGARAAQRVHVAPCPLDR